MTQDATSPIIRSFELAEAGTFDGRGLPALIGFSPSVWRYPSFPTTVTAFVISIGEDESGIGQPGNPSSWLAIDLSVRDPAGEVIFFQSARAPGGEKDDESLPSRIQVAAQIMFEAATPGDYRVVARVTRDGREETYVRTMYIRPAA